MEHFNNYILWAQNPAISSDDIMAVDGQYLSPETGNDFFAYMSVLPTDGDVVWTPIFKSDKSFKVGKNSNVSPSFAVYQNSDGCTLVKSLFVDKDETGRRIAYLFCCPSLDLKTVAATLGEAAHFVGKTPNAADMAIISALGYKKYIKYFTLILLIVILVTILIIHYGSR